MARRLQLIDGRLGDGVAETARPLVADQYEYLHKNVPLRGIRFEKTTAGRAAAVRNAPFYRQGDVATMIGDEAILDLGRAW